MNFSILQNYQDIKKIKEFFHTPLTQQDLGSKKDFEALCIKYKKLINSLFNNMHIKSLVNSWGIKTKVKNAYNENKYCL